MSDKKSPQKSPKHLPSLCYKSSPMSDYIIAHCDRLTTPYLPPLGTRNRHIQTLVGSVFRALRWKFDFVRECFPLKDNGTIALDWGACGIEHLKKDSPILIVIPGLTGIASDYGHLCKRAVQRGFRVVVFNKRGHGGSTLSTPKLQSLGDPSDFREVVEYIHERYPGCVVSAVASSAGCGLLVSYLGEYKSDAFLAAGVCISPGYDVRSLWHHGFGGFYDSYLKHNLKYKIILPNQKILSQILDIDQVKKCRRMEELEKCVYCKIYGYTTLEDYWQHNDPVRKYMDVAAPVLCINSLDDPICKKYQIPYDLFQQHSQFMLVTTKKGGHCAFLEGSHIESWADQLGLDYITAIITYQKHQLLDGTAQ